MSDLLFIADQCDTHTMWPYHVRGVLVHRHRSCDGAHGNRCSCGKVREMVAVGFLIPDADSDLIW